MTLTYLAAFLLAVPVHETQAPVRGSPIRPQSRVWITGASNIRRFTCAARRVSGAIELRGAPTGRTILVGRNTSSRPSLSVTVDELDCGIGVMSHHLHDVLRSAQHPSIEFRLSTYEVNLTAAVPVARITGMLTIAGVQRPVATTATVRADSLGLLHVVGAYVVRPTDFGVAPPRRFGGLLRVRDRAAVHFDIALDPDGGAIDEIGCSLIQSP